MGAKTYKIYEWGTIHKGQVRYDDLSEATEQIATALATSPKRLKLTPCILKGYLVDDTAFFVAAEEQPDDEHQIKLDQAQNFIDEMCAENNSQVRNDT